MRKSRNGTRFLLEALHTRRIRRERRWQDFDRDVAREARVACLIDFAHPACTQRHDDFVRTEAGALGESQTAEDYIGNGRASRT
jgi:hypothetical protein